MTHQKSWQNHKASILFSSTLTFRGLPAAFRPSTDALTFSCTLWTLAITQSLCIAILQAQPTPKKINLMYSLMAGCQWTGVYISNDQQRQYSTEVNHARHSFSPRVKRTSFFLGLHRIWLFQIRPKPNLAETCFLVTEQYASDKTNGVSASFVALLFASYW